MTIGAVCLGRDRSVPETIITTSSKDNGDQVGTTRTTSAESDPSGGTVTPAASPNVTSTTIIVNPASASANDNSGGTQPQQPIIIQQAAPASAPPAPASTDQQPSAAQPASTVSPESVEAQDQRDQMREQESYQQQGTQIIPVPVGNGGGAPGTQVPMRDPNIPGANNPPSNYYPPGASRAGQIGPNVPNGGASTFSAAGGQSPQMGTFGGRR